MRNAMRNVMMTLYVAGAVATIACVGVTARRRPATVGATMRDDASLAPMRSTIDRDTARLRAATAAFRSLDAAVAAGYPRSGGECVSYPAEGGMGFHHNNPRLMDDRVEVERPEVLVYRRTDSGEYELTGVEYMVPFSATPRDGKPPMIMGQQLKPFNRGQFWYLHAWVWLDNPSGLFADWNPKVTCRAPEASRGQSP